MRFLINAWNAKKTSRSDDAQQWQVDAEVRQLIELLREAKGGGVSEAFAGALKDLADHGPDIEKGIVAWVQLIEELIQGAESRYPDGRGGRKQAQVRAALHELLSDPNIRIPGVPRSVEPLVMNVVIDWSINALVDSLNGYELWSPTPPPPWSLRRLGEGIAIAVVAALHPVLGLLNWLYVKFRFSEPLTPEVKAALARVKQVGLVRDKGLFFRSAADLIQFIAQHGEQTAAGVKAFFEVVAMAERLESASGPAKKSYACAIVKATLEALGFPVEGGLIGVIADAVISAGVESALALFQKRAPESFASRSALRSPSSAIAA